MNKIVLIGLLIGLLPFAALAGDIPRDGIYKEYYDSGKIKAEYHYQNGQLNGPAHLYFENGFLREEALYKNGKLHGINKKYYTNGLLAERATYSNGVVVGVPFKFKYGDIPPQKPLPDQNQEKKIKKLAWWAVLDDARPGPKTDAALQKLKAFIKERFMFAGIPEADYTLAAEKERLFVRVSSLFDKEELIMLLSSPGILYFKGIESDPAVVQNNRQKLSPEYEWIEINNKELLMEKTPWLTVKAVETADVREAGYNKKRLVLTLRKTEAEILKDMTTKHVGELTAVVLGDRAVTVLTVAQPLLTGELTFDNELLSGNMQHVVFSLVFSPDVPVNFKLEETDSEIP